MTTTKKTTKSAQAKTAEAAVVEAVETAAAASREAVDLAVKTSNDVTGKGFEKAVSATKEQVAAASKAGRETFKGYEDVIAYHKDNFDAVIEASNIWVNGVQNINRALGEMASKSVEKSAETTKKMLSCKTVEDVIALNNDSAKASYDAAVTETRTIHEMGVRLAESSAKPLAQRVNETVAQFSRQVAA